RTYSDVLGHPNLPLADGEHVCNAPSFVWGYLADLIQTEKGVVGQLGNRFKAVAGRAPSLCKTLRTTAPNAAGDCQCGGLSRGRRPPVMEPAWLLLDDFEQRADEGKGQCQDEARVANAKAPNFVLPLAERTLLVITVRSTARPVIFHGRRIRWRDCPLRQNERLLMPTDTGRDKDVLGHLILHP